jgi:paraquat-inducible protein B
MTRVLDQAAATLRTYDTTSDINRGSRDALRNIQEAANAITSLARAIQRNPNSLLLGK